MIKVNQTVTANTDTFLKFTPTQSNDLERIYASDVTDYGVRDMSDGCLLFPRLLTLPIIYSDAGNGSHTKVSIDAAEIVGNSITEKALKLLPQTDFYIYSPDIKLVGTPPDNKPADANPTTEIVKQAIASNTTAAALNPEPLDTKLYLPGYKTVFTFGKEIVPGCKISWAEWLHFNPDTKQYRPPEDSAVVNNILRMATLMRDWVKPTIAAAFANVTAEDIAITVNSGYRDPVTNLNVGGARYSRHLWGDALDFRVIIRPRVVNGVLQPAQLLRCDRVNSILSKWTGGLASASVFSHIDGRGFTQMSKSGWLEPGSYARWSYGF